MNGESRKNKGAKVTNAHQKTKYFKFYFPAMIIFSVAAVIMRTFALINHLGDDGYFSEKLFINIANGIAVFGVIYLLSYLFVEKKDIKLIPSFDSPANYVPGAVVATALTLFGVNLFRYALSVKHASKITLPLSVVCAILAILSALYFVFSGIIVRRRSIKRADFGLIMLLFICAYVAFLYFDVVLPINAPNKIVDQTAYLGAAIFFLYETRLSLGREKWRAYICFGLVSALLFAYSSIPSLIYYFAEGKIISSSIYENILSFTLFLFVCSKLLLTSSLIEDKESPVVTKIIAAAKARSEAIKPKEPNVEASQIPEEDENQISISEMSISEDEETAQEKALPSNEEATSEENASADGEESKIETEEDNKSE